MVCLYLFFFERRLMVGGGCCFCSCMKIRHLCPPIAPAAAQMKSQSKTSVARRVGGSGIGWWTSWDWDVSLPSNSGKWRFRSLCKNVKFLVVTIAWEGGQPKLGDWFRRSPDSLESIDLFGLGSCMYDHDATCFIEPSHLKAWKPRSRSDSCPAQPSIFSTSQLPCLPKVLLKQMPEMWDFSTEAEDNRMEIFSCIFCWLTSTGICALKLT